MPWVQSAGRLAEIDCSLSQGGPAMLKRCGALPIVSFLVLASLFGIQPTGADTLPPLANLAPGTDLRIQQNVDVNVVLIGFGARADAATVLAELQTLPPFNGV